jgi:hypothetical protein
MSHFVIELRIDILETESNKIIGFYHNLNKSINQEDFNKGFYIVPNN